MKLDFWAGNSASPEKFPPEVSGNLLPNDVVPIQLVFGLEQRKTRQVLIFAEEFTKLVQYVRVTQKVFTIFWTMFLKWLLNLTKHESKSVF